MFAATCACPQLQLNSLTGSPLPALPILSSTIRWCLQLQLDNLVTDFQKVTEDLKRRFVVNGEPLIEEGMVVGGSPMGSGSFKRMTGFTLPQRPTMASSGDGEQITDLFMHILEKWAGELGRLHLPQQALCIEEDSKAHLVNIHH